MNATRCGRKVPRGEWQVLNALLGGALRPADIAQRVGRNEVSIHRRCAQLASWGLIDLLTTGRYRLTDEGRPYAEAPDPGQRRYVDLAPKRPTSAPPPPPSKPSEPVAPDARLMPAERRLLEWLCAQPAMPIAEIARARGVSVQTVRDAVAALEVRGLVQVADHDATIPQRIPVPTVAGRARILSSEPASTVRFVTADTSGGYVKPDATGEAALRLMMSGPVGAVEVARACNLTTPDAGRLLAQLAGGGYALRDGECFGITDKGRRWLSGELRLGGPRLLAPVPPTEATPKPTPVPKDPDALVPAALRTRGGIRHPSIPKPAEKPRGMSRAAWAGAVVPNWSVGGVL